VDIAGMTVYRFRGTQMPYYIQKGNGEK